jgi:hypothetical protein
VRLLSGASAIERRRRRGSADHNELCQYSDAWLRRWTQPASLFACDPVLNSRLPQRLGRSLPPHSRPKDDVLNSQLLIVV